MVSKRAKAHILQTFHDAEINLSGARNMDDVRAVAQDLTALKFATASTCGSVRVLHNGASMLVDMAIDDQALEDNDSQRLAGIIERTIQQGEATVREMLQQMAVKNTKKRPE